MQDSASWNSSTLILPARTSSDMDQVLVPEPMSVPRYLPESIGPPETAIAGISTLAVPISSEGWSCRSPPAESRHQEGWRGSIPRRPSTPGCGTASQWAASASRPATSPEIPAENRPLPECRSSCLLYTSDAADDLLCVDLGGRRIIK